MPAPRMCVTDDILDFNHRHPRTQTPHSSENELGLPDPKFPEHVSLMVRGLFKWSNSKSRRHEEAREAFLPVLPTLFRIPFDVEGADRVSCRTP